MSQITINPAALEWVALAKKNRTVIRDALGRGVFKGIDIPALLEFRQSVINTARQFTQAVFAGSNREVQADPILIAAGHQPVIYHSGVMRKNVTIEQVVNSPELFGLNVIVNTDSGEGGKLTYPQCGNAQLPEIGTVDLAQGGTLYLSQRIKDPAAVKEGFLKISQQLERLPGYTDDVRSNLARAECEYVERSNLEVSIANTAVRRSFSPTAHVDEMLLTDLVSLPFARNFYASIIGEGKTFVTRFNEQLDLFRVKRKIKNHANPFPNLGLSPETVELPFWCVDRESGERHALFLRLNDNALISRGDNLGHAEDATALLNWKEGDRYRIAPRAMMITCLLRLFVSDFFVHGVGGARYDAFLDDFIESYWGIAAPVFATATETRLFCPTAAAELERKLEILSQTREIQFHLGKYLENGTFSPEMSQRLRHHWQSRQAFVAELKELQANKQPAAQVTQRLKQADVEIKNELQTFFSSIEVPPEDTQKVIRYREFPFFLFSQEQH